MKKNKLLTSLVLVTHLLTGGRSYSVSPQARRNIGQYALYKKNHNSKQKKIIEYVKKHPAEILPPAILMLMHLMCEIGTPISELLKPLPKNKGLKLRKKCVPKERLQINERLEFMQSLLVDQTAIDVLTRECKKKKPGEKETYSVSTAVWNWIKNFYKSPYGKMVAAYEHLSTSDYGTCHELALAEHCQEMLDGKKQRWIVVCPTATNSLFDHMFNIYVDNGIGDKPVMYGVDHYRDWGPVALRFARTLTERKVYGDAEKWEVMKPINPGYHNCFETVRGHEYAKFLGKNADDGGLVYIKENNRDSYYNEIVLNDPKNVKWYTKRTKLITW